MQESEETWGRVAETGYSICLRNVGDWRKREGRVAVFYFREFRGFRLCFREFRLESSAEM